MFVDIGVLLYSEDGADPVKHGEVLGDCLAGNGQLCTQTGSCSGSVAKQQVEHASPCRVTNRRPKIVVNFYAHQCALILAA